MKTYQPKAGEIDRRWILLDAAGKNLGRLAVQVAGLLRGKGKPSFVPHLDVGDFVVVINAEKVTVTGKKLRQKTYYHHSQYPGGIKAVNARTVRLRVGSATTTGLSRNGTTRVRLPAAPMTLTT